MKMTSEFGEKFAPPASGLITANRILQALPPPILAQIMVYADRIDLHRDEVLVEAHGRVSRVYFIERGLALFTKMMSDGRSTMTASVGHEGMTLPNMVGGAKRTGTECMVLIPGTALSIDRSVLLDLASKSPSLSLVLQQYSLFMNEQITQISACNRLHSLEQRCARFLLTANQAVQGQAFTLTQEVMAMILGAQRPHISMVAIRFRKKNLIEYRHGQMRVTNPDRLRLASCECHDMLKEGVEGMFMPVWDSAPFSSRLRPTAHICAGAPQRLP